MHSRFFASLRIAVRIGPPHPEHSKRSTWTNKVAARLVTFVSGGENTSFMALGLKMIGSLISLWLNGGVWFPERVDQRPRPNGMAYQIAPPKRLVLECRLF